MVNTKDGDNVESWFRRRHLTLDLAGMTEDERSEGSGLLGGSAVQFVAPEEVFNLSEVSTVVFEWGDPRIEEVFAAMLEHDDAPNFGLFPFSASAIVGDMVWMLDIQDREFSPERNFRDSSQYVIVPLAKDEGTVVIDSVSAMPHPWPERLARIGTRWVAFSVGTNIR